MARDYRNTARLTRAERVATVLSELQREVEHTGNAQDKARRRAILRGMRIAAWLLVDARPSMREVTTQFRCELFDLPAPVMPADDDD
ncbi:hypothetical protein [Pseudomonas sp. JUb96]|uniref:hypothetical protein n=1 Tax=Pseudomonas sp. JUb96 TaxID=2940539 RepID=UPI002225C8CC|nr:hypothetical protein [Pseudomonas sp. JUb96]MCW2267590.1 hypothetical protein [Pseudomonas sp. JUb96]